MKYLALLLVFALAQGRLFGEDQRICVKGKVECTSNPENQAKQIVKLWDNDRGPNPDDLMSEGITDEDGFFELCGTGSDAIGSIDPVFKIYTRCNNDKETEKGCYRKIRFPINQRYISRTYEFPEVINLDRTHSSEERRCLTGSKLDDFLKKYSLNSASEWLNKLTDGSDGWFEKIKEKGSKLINNVTQKGKEVISDLTGGADETSN